MQSVPCAGTYRLFLRHHPMQRRTPGVAYPGRREGDHKTALGFDYRASTLHVSFQRGRLPPIQSRSQHQGRREREREGWAAREFFVEMLTADCDRIAVENPAPMKYFDLPRYDQIIEPYQYGHPWKKRTCLWLKNLPPLEPTEIVEPTGCWTVSGGGSTCRIRLKGKGGARSQRERARTFPGIARAMAEQWGGDL